MSSFAEALAELPTPVVATSIVATLMCIWLMSYVSDWLHQLESAPRSPETDGFLEDPTSLQKVPLPLLSQPASKYLSIIFPAYDEEARLPLTLEETMRYLRQRERVEKGFSYEILVVDDGSKDRTVEAGFEYVRKHTVDKVRVIKLGKNQGKGAAVRKGMLHARGELLLFADADGATKISELETLERELKDPASATGTQEPTHVLGIPKAAFGSRAHLEKQALATRKWYRNVLMYGFHLCVLLAAGPGVRDTQCGFKMFTRPAARLLFPNQRLNRWCFDVELVYLAKRLRVPIVEKQVQWTEIAGSKVRMSSIVNMLLELALIRLGYGLRVWKINKAPL